MNVLKSARSDCAAVISTFEGNSGRDERGVYEPTTLVAQQSEPSDFLWRSNAQHYVINRDKAIGKTSSTKALSFLLDNPRLVRIVLGILGGK